MIITSTPSLSFGRITVGENKLKEFTIFNDAAYPVSASLSSSSPQFVITPPLSFSIPANGSTIVRVTFTPLNDASYSATLTITHNDPINPAPVLVSMSGDGIRPVISISTSLIDFSYVSINDTKKIDILVNNTSTEAKLKITAITGIDSVFWVTPTTLNIDPQRQGTLSFFFKPSVSGIQTRILQIINNSSNSPNHSVNLQGNGQIPTAVVNRTSINYGNVTINDSKIEHVIFSNTSSLPIRVLISNVSTNNTKFKETVGAITLEKDSALDIPVTFNPTDTSTQSGILLIQSNAGNFSVSLTGKGTATPNIQVSATFVNFGKIGLGSVITKKIRISNVGVASLNVNQIFSDNPKYTLSNSTIIIPVSSVFDLSITYTPVQPQADIGKLYLRSNDPDSPEIIIDLSGEGVTPAIQATGINYGKVGLGNVSIKDLTIKNSSDVPLIINSITLPSHFTMTETVPFTISSRRTKPVEISFTPVVVGVDSGMAVISSNDFNNPTFSVELKGEGVVPHISVIPTTINFGDVAVNSTDEKEIVVSNTGQSELVISEISSSNTSFEPQSDTLTVLPGSTERMNIFFNPTTYGIKAGTITFVNNDPFSPNIIVAVSGNGSVAEIMVDLRPINFGDVAINDTKVLDLKISNVGLANLIVNNSIGDAKYHLSDSSFLIELGSNETLKISFKPTALGTFPTQLSLQSNDPTNPSIAIVVTGSGANIARIKTSGTQISFGEIQVGSDQSKLFTIQNIGTAILTYDVTIDNSVFTSTPSTGNIGAGITNSINVKFKPTVPGDVQATMTIHSNDPNNPVVTVALKGKAKAGTMAWVSFGVDEIIPKPLAEFAGKISDVLTVITQALQLVTNILNILKVLIISITDPKLAALKAIQKLIEDFINDIASSGFYMLQILPGDNRLNPQTYHRLTIDLSPNNLVKLPKSIKEKYYNQIRNRITKVEADEEDIGLMLGGWSNVKDFLNSVKGGSGAFFNRVMDSFSDVGDSHRPQFSSSAVAGAVLLVGDTGDLTTLINYINTLKNIFMLEISAQFAPPTNLTSFADNKKIRLTFSPSEGLLSNAYLIWRSEVSGGEKIDPPLVDANGTQINTTDENGRNVTRYKLIKVLTLRDQLALINNVSKETAQGWITDSANYVKGLISVIENLPIRVMFEDSDSALVNGKNYYYTVTSANINDVNNPDQVMGITYSDEMVKIRQTDLITFKQAKIPIDYGLIGWGEMSSEVSATPTDLTSITSTLNRCSYYRCTYDKDITEEFDISKSELESDATISKTLKNVPKPSTVMVNVVVGKDAFSLPPTDYNVRDKIVSFTKPKFFDAGNKLKISYSYSDVKTKEVIGEKHTAIGASRVLIPLGHTPISSINQVKLDVPITDFVAQIFNDKTLVLEFSSSVPSGTFVATVDYVYFVEDATLNFRCVNQEFNKYNFDVVKCADGTQRCPGYTNLNCFFNNGEGCTNTNTSSKEFVTIEKVGETNVKNISSENVLYSTFYDSIYCQNGVMKGRCNGYSQVDDRFGYKGISPDWSRFALVDLFPAIKDLTKLMKEIIASLISGTEKFSQSIISFIDLLQKKIDSLQKIIDTIKSITDMIANNFKGPKFYLLNIPPAIGGNQYLINSIKNAKDGPSSDAFGYTAGVVIVYGGANSDALFKALSIFF